jgi:hypothetical protein
MKTKSPTLLEIATNFALWQEYADPSGIDSEEQFNARSASENLALLQQCGYGEAYRGNMYDYNGHLIGENLLIQIEPNVGTADVPTIVIGCTPHRTQDFRGLTSGSLHGPGGWYVVVRATEGGEE